MRQDLEQVLMNGQLELGNVHRDLVEEVPHGVGDTTGADHERLEKAHDRLGDVLLVGVGADRAREHHDERHDRVELVDLGLALGVMLLAKDLFALE